MDLQDVMTNAGINIGLAILFLSIFSLVSKQPANAGVYYTRELLRHRRKEIDKKELRTLGSFIPSVGWVVRAWRVTEEEILESTGLDAVVLLRIFSFSIKLFSVCSAIGLFILIPTTLTAGTMGSSDWNHQDFDKFSINNIDHGSKRFWVHFGAIYLISFIIYAMLYMEYKAISNMRLAYIFHTEPRPDQFSVLVRSIPKHAEGKSYTDNVQEFFSHLYPDVYLSHQMVYRAGGLENMIAKLEKMKGEVDRLKEMPEVERKLERIGFCGLWGKKVDPVEKTTLKIEILYQKIKDAQHTIRHKSKEIPAAVVSFKTRSCAAVAAQSRQAENALTWVTEWAPEPRDVYWENLSIASATTWLRRIIAAVVVVFITFFYCIPSAFIAAINGISSLEGIVPEPILNILRLPGLESLVSGYLSTLLLACLLYLVPITLLLLTRMEGYSSKSTQEIKASKKYFYFLAGPIFFIQVLGGGAIGIYKEWDFIKRPTDIPARLASLIPGQATFFMSYIMTTGWAGFPLEILNVGVLFLNFFKRHTVNDDSSKPELSVYAMQYYKILPNVLLFIFVGIIYSVIAPLLPPFLLVYFGLGYIIYKNQVINVYEPAYETAGQYWPLVHSRIMAALGITQVTFVGIFQVKMGTSTSLLAVPLLAFSFIFHQYCLKRFFPVFVDLSVESARKRDKDDEQRGIQGEVLDIIPDAYLHPGMEAVDITGYGNDNIDGLLRNQSQRDGFLGEGSFHV